METKAYMYVLECADGSLYTGYTTNVEKRLKTHNAGKGAKYTRARLPVKLLYKAENNKAGVVKSISIFIGISKLEYCKDKVNIPIFSFLFTMKGISLQRRAARGAAPRPRHL